MLIASTNLIISFNETGPFSQSRNILSVLEVRFSSDIILKKHRVPSGTLCFLELVIGLESMTSVVVKVALIILSYKTTYS